MKTTVGDNMDDRTQKDSEGTASSSITTEHIKTWKMWRESTTMFTTTAASAASDNDKERSLLFFSSLLLGNGEVEDGGKVTTTSKWTTTRAARMLTETAPTNDAAPCPPKSGCSRAVLGVHTVRN